jgi:hypothetical protein
MPIIFFKKFINNAAGAYCLHTADLLLLCLMFFSTGMPAEKGRTAVLGEAAATHSMLAAVAAGGGVCATMPRGHGSGADQAMR